MKSDRVLFRTAVTFIVRSVGVLLVFLLNVVVARILGVEAAGTYFLSITILMTITMVTRLGFDQALIKFIGAASDEDKYKYVYWYGLVAAKLAILASVFLGILIYLTAGVIDQHIFPNISVYNELQIIAYGLIPMSLVWIVSGILKGLRSPATSALIETVLMPLLVIIGLIILQTRINVSPEISLLIYIISALMCVIVGVGVIASKININNISEYGDTSGVVSASIHMMIAAITGFLITWSPSLFLGVFTDAESVAHYNVAFRTAMLISFILIVMNSVVSPRFASLYKKQSLGLIEELAGKSALLMVVFVTPIVFVLLMWPDLVLSLYGEQYTSASNMLRVITIGQFVNVFCGSVGYILMMTGHEIEMRNIMLFSLGITIILNIILINLHGVMGAAIGVSASMILQNILMTWFVYKRLEIRIFPRLSIIKKLAIRK